MITKAVIPAAGLGTRLLPATIAQPKEMLPIVDKPVIQFVVEEAVSAGLTDILIVTGRNKRAIEDHFDPPLELEETLIQKKKSDILKTIKYISQLANIHFVRQKKQLGLAHAIYQAKAFIGRESFAVLLGDTILHPNHDLKQMLAWHEKTQQSIVAVEKVVKEKVSRYGIIKGRKKTAQVYEVEDLVEKPSVKTAPSQLAVASRYIFTPEIFSLINKTRPGVGREIQITDSMKPLAHGDKLLAYQIKAKRYDIGAQVDFIKATLDFALQRPELKTKLLNYLKQLIK